MSWAVIIPTYKRPDVLASLLADIAAQTRQPDEIIVVDDTPDDSIQDVCRDAPIDVRFIRNEGPPGITQARNEGLRHTDAQRITFFDSDARLEPEYLSALASTLERHPDAPGAMGHVTDYPANPTRRRILRLLLLSHSRPDRCRLLFPPRVVYPQPLTRELRTNWLFGCNMTYRREAIEGLWFDESMRRYAYMEDLDFSSRVVQRSGHEYVITPGARMRHERSPAGRVHEVDLFRMRLVNKYYLAYGRRLRLRDRTALKVQDIGNLLWYGFWAPLKSVRYLAAMVHVWWLVARFHEDLEARRLDRFNAHYRFERQS